MPVRHSVGAQDDERRSVGRHARFSSLAVLWDLSTLGRVRGCRRVGVQPNGSAQLVATGEGAERRAGFSGLATCGSTWACPCCAERIAAGRQDELAAALSGWQATGARVAMVTLTMRHNARQSLQELWDGVSAAWGAVTSGRGWQSLHVRYGATVTRTLVQGPRRGEVVTEPRVGWTRVVEVTHGEHGWHVHVHAALFLAPGVTKHDVADIGKEMFTRWRDRLVRDGFAAPIAGSGGLDARLWTGQAAGIAAYFTKNRFTSTAERLAAEITRGATKVAEQGNRTPFRVLADLVDEPGNARDRRLWAEWEQASTGRRQMTWAQGWRALLVTEPELTDDELAAEDVLGGRPILDLPRETLRAMARGGLHAGLLDCAEWDTDGTWARMYLDSHGLAWSEPLPEPVPWAPAAEPLPPLVLL